MKEVKVSHSKRNPTLDVIRGVAVLLIVLHHICMPASFPITNTAEWLFRKVLMRTLYLLDVGGWIGVDLFFVLSGFLISGLLFNEYKKYQKIDIKRFLVRRGFKIYPAFLFFMLFTFAAERIVSNYTPIAYHPITEYVKDLFFLHNYLEGRWGQTWSLDIEEFFYICLPFLLFYLVSIQKLSISVLLKIYLFLLFSGIIARAFAVYNHQAFDFNAQYARTHFRLDGLFLGVFISYLFNFHPSSFKPILTHRALYFIMASSAILLNFFIHRGYHIWVPPVIMVAVNPIAFSVLIIQALHLQKGLSNRYLEYIGKYSYSIYLWHYVFADYFKMFIPAANKLAKSFSDDIFGYPYIVVYIVYILFYVICSILLGVVLGKIIEEPFIKIRDRLFPSKTKAIATLEEVKDTTVIAKSI